MSLWWCAHLFLKSQTTLDFGGCVNCIISSDDCWLWIDLIRLGRFFISWILYLFMGWLIYLISWFAYLRSVSQSKYATIWRLCHASPETIGDYCLALVDSFSFFCGWTKPKKYLDTYVTHRICFTLCFALVSNWCRFDADEIFQCFNLFPQFSVIENDEKYIRETYSEGAITLPLVYMHTYMH